MARPCKSCSSKIRSEIDKQLLNGVSYSQVQKYCLARGFRITEKSLREYALNHVKDFVAHAKAGFNYTPTDTPRNETAKECELKPLLVETVKTSDVDTLIEVLETKLLRSIANAASIVDDKLIRYMQGECQAPSNEVRLLKYLVEVADILTGTVKHKRAGKHIFDLKTALENNQKQSLDVDALIADNFAKFTSLSNTEES